MQFVPTPAPRIRIEAEYQLKNTGNQPLARLRLIVPAAESYQRANTRAEFAGQPAELRVQPGARESSRGDDAQISWQDPWPQKQRRVLTVTYELSTGYRSGSSLAIAENTFFASAGSWAPELAPPAGTFAQGGKAPKKWELAVRVPPGFLVYASGADRGRRDDQGEWVYRFEQRHNNFAAFAAGGRYHEQKVCAHGETILFWTLQPLDESSVRSAGEKIAARLRYYEQEYGPRGNGDQTVRLLECVIPRQDFGCGQLPQTVMVHPAWIARGLKDKDFLVDANFELAYTWFGQIARVRFDVSPLPMDALAPYAGWEAQAVEDGPGARKDRLQWLLADYDRRVKSCKDKIALPMQAGYHGCGYSPAWSKSGMFFFALEDSAGRERLHRALRRMIQARRGRDYNLEDLIAALEAETHRDEAEFIRHWLKHPGIPDEFRVHYGSDTSQMTPSSEETTP